MENERNSYILPGGVVRPGCGGVEMGGGFHVRQLGCVVGVVQCSAVWCRWCGDLGVWVGGWGDCQSVGGGPPQALARTTP